MAKKKDRLTEVGAKVGSTLGKANRQAQKILDARAVAKQDLDAISKQVEALTRQLQKTAQRLKKALT